MAKKKKVRTPKVAAKQNMSFVVSKDKNPKIKVSPNTKIELVKVNFQNAEGTSDKAVLASLCGYGSSYCVALVEY